MLTTNLHYAKAIINPYFLGEVCLHDDVDAKEASNKILWKKVSILIAYALASINFANFANVQVFDAPLQAIHLPIAPSQNMPM